MQLTKKKYIKYNHSVHSFNKPQGCLTVTNLTVSKADLLKGLKGWQSLLILFCINIERTLTTVILHKVKSRFSSKNVISEQKREAKVP